MSYESDAYVSLLSDTRNRLSTVTSLRVIFMTETMINLDTSIRSQQAKVVGK